MTTNDLIESARCGFEVLIRRIRSLEHDIEAYRGALGYPVTGDHDGLLFDGTVPVNGLLEAIRKRQREVNKQPDNYCPRCHSAMYP